MHLYNWCVSDFLQWPTNPLRKDISPYTPCIFATYARDTMRISCVQRRWRNHHATWHSTKNHLRKPEKAISETKGRPSGHGPCHAGPLSCPPRTAGERILLHPHSWELRLVMGPSQKLQAPQQPPTSRALPSAFVSVLPSSSRKGVSCSRIGRKENKCRSMDQIWWTSILKATLVLSPAYLHIHILETRLDERNVVSERPQGKSWWLWSF